MSNLPETIKISGVEYEVEEAEHQNQGNDILAGQIDYFHAKIYINQDANDKVKEQILLHEITHGMLVAMGREKLNKDEYFVDALSYQLYQVLKDNHLYFGENTEKSSHDGQTVKIYCDGILHDTTTHEELFHNADGEDKVIGNGSVVSVDGSNYNVHMVQLLANGTIVVNAEKL